MECKAGFTKKDICKGSKDLKEVKKVKEVKNSLGYDTAIAEKYAKTYDQFDGDIGAIFGMLGECPRKAFKHPPKNAEDFGIKYAQGFYSDVESK